LRERARHHHQPFFLYLAYNAPHTPHEPLAEWLEKVKQRAPHLEEKLARNVALIEHLHDGVGRILDALQERGERRMEVIVP
jgi:arylsulfatase A-like enzyme